MSTTYIRGDNIVFTNNSGNDITIKAAGGKKLILENVEVATTNILQATNFIGQIASFPTVESSGGFLPCDGSVCSKVDYPLLYAKIGGTFGETTETFTLPDYTSESPVFDYSIFAGLPVSGIAYGTEVNYSFVFGGSTNGNRFFGNARTYVSGDQTLMTFLGNDTFRLPTSTVGRKFFLEVNYLGSSATTSLPLVKTDLGIDVLNASGDPEGIATTVYSTIYEFIQTDSDAIFEFRGPVPPSPYYPVTPYNSTGTIKLKIY